MEQGTHSQLMQKKDYTGRCISVKCQPGVIANESKATLMGVAFYWW